MRSAGAVLATFSRYLEWMGAGGVEWDLADQRTIRPNAEEANK